MATATTPTLGGQALALPSEQSYSIEYRGGTLRMADGSIVHDLVDTTARYRFRLSWTLITAAQKSTILTAYAGIKNATATYVSIENTSHTVTRPDGGEPDVMPIVTAGGDVKFNLSLELIEDS